jgi:Biotin synthase and related enzymes
MDKEIVEKIDKARETAMSGKEVDRATLLEFLRLPTDSGECDYLRSTAGEMKQTIVGNKVFIATAIGLDWVPCAGNCSFCSLGEKWRLVKETAEIPDDEVVKIIRNIYNKGYRVFTLRTTEYYDLDHLSRLGKKVRKEVPEDDYTLGVNTGELTFDQAEMLYESGYTSAYHVVRLREGIDTPFDPELRLQTMRNIHRSRLNLGASIDPLGIEHTNEEILDQVDLLKQFSPRSMGIIRRICVPGTPKGDYEMVSDKRLAQVLATLRIAKRDWMVACGQASPVVLKSGSGTITCETGASPRRTGMNNLTWSLMDHDSARALIKECGMEFFVPPIKAMMANANKKE